MGKFDEIIMPPVTQTSEEMQIVTWHVKEGDAISVGQVILEIQTDKAVLEVEATAGGVVRKIFFLENEKAPVNAVLALVGSADEEIPAAFDPLHRLKKNKAEADEASSKRPEVVASSKTVSEKKDLPEGAGNISPAAKFLAREMKVSWQDIEGTGPGGMITRKDILKKAS